MHPTPSHVLSRSVHKYLCMQHAELLLCQLSWFLGIRRDRTNFPIGLTEAAGIVLPMAFPRNFPTSLAENRNNFSTMSVDICLIGRRYFPIQTIIIVSTYLTGALDIVL